MFVLRLKRNSDVEKYVKSVLLNFQDIMFLNKAVKNGVHCGYEVLKNIKDETFKLSSIDIVESFFGHDNICKYYYHNDYYYIGVRNINKMPKNILVDCF